MSQGGHRKVAYGLSGATGIVHCLCSKMPMKKILVTIQKVRDMLKDPEGSCDQPVLPPQGQKRSPSPKASWTLKGPSCMTWGWSTLNTLYQI